MIRESLRLGHGPRWMHEQPTEDVELMLAADQAEDEIKRRRREDAVMAQYGQRS
jgi:hypothetical protein